MIEHKFIAAGGIQNHEIKLDLLKASPDTLIERAKEQIAENARYATAW